MFMYMHMFFAQIYLACCFFSRGNWEGLTLFVSYTAGP
jgi:hypothetical protein